MKQLTSKKAAEILGVPIDISLDELKQRWKKLARQYHPDFHPNNKDKEQWFKLINKSFQLLSNMKDSTKLIRAMEEELFDDHFESWLNIIDDTRKQKILDDLHEFINETNK